jgi:hypothetical protein
MDDGTVSDGDDHLRGIAVPFRGGVIRCATLADAAEVANADAILSDRDTSFYFPVELDRLATVLEGYGQEEAANVLRERANRLRDAVFREPPE